MLGSGLPPPQTRVGRIVDVRLHDRGIDAQLAPRHDALLACQADDPFLQGSDHFRAQHLPQPHQRLRIRFLLAAALAMFAFAVLLPVIVFVAVVSDSAALATMVTYFVALMSLIFSQHERIAPYFDSQWPRDLVKGLYHTTVPTSIRRDSVSHGFTA